MLSVPMSNLGTPLHPAQKGLYIEQLIHGASAKYNIGGYVRFVGKFARDHLETAAKHFWMLNETTRISITSVQGEGQQRVEQLTMPAIAWIDLNNQPREAAVNWMQSRMDHSYELQTEALEEQAILKIHDQEHWYFLRHHHICCDAMSISLRIKHTLAFYQALVNGEELQAVTPDFPSYQQESIQAASYFDSEQYHEDQRYWQAKTAAINHAPSLPTTAFGKQQKRGQVEYPLQSKTKDTLLKFCKENGYSVHQTLLGVTTLLLSKLTDASDVVVGYPIHNRVYKSQKRMYGMLSSILPLFTSVSETDTVTTLLERVKETQQQDLAHRKYPWSHTLRQIRESHQDKQRLFDVVANFQPFYQTPGVNGMEVTFHELSSKIDDTPIHITLCDYGEQQPMTLKVASIFGQYHSQILADILISLLTQISFSPLKVPHLNASCEASLNALHSAIYFHNSTKLLPYCKHKEGATEIAAEPAHEPVCVPLTKATYHALLQLPETESGHLISLSWFLLLAKISQQAYISADIVRLPEMFVQGLSCSAQAVQQIPNWTMQFPADVQLSTLQSLMPDPTKIQPDSWQINDVSTQVMFLPNTVPLDASTTSELFGHKDMTLSITLAEGNFSLQLWHDTASQLRDTVQRWADHLSNLLTQLTDGHARSFADITLLSLAQQQRILMTEHTNSDTTEGVLLPQLVQQQCHTFPDKTAVYANNSAMGYAELNTRVNKLANYLQSQHIRSGDFVAICLSRDHNLLVAMLATLKVGAAFVPVDPGYPDARITSIIRSAKPQLILVDELSKTALPDTQDPRLVDLTRVDWLSASEHFTNPPASPTQPAYMLFTSGSTGTPKGVVISQRALSNFISAMGERIALDENTRWLAITTIAFDISLLELLGPLAHGGQVILVQPGESLDPKRLESLIGQYNVNFLQATPSSWKMILDHQWQGNNALTALSGGEPINSNLIKRLLPKVQRLWNCYGPTEATVWSMVREISEQQSEYQQLCLTASLKGYGHYILDDFLAPQPIGVQGELYIAGESLAEGYHNMPELTQDRFITYELPDGSSIRLYKTGDSAKWTEDLTIEILGRTDDQLKIRGHRIEPGEIEHQLQCLQTVTQAVVIGVQNAHSATDLAAFITVTSEHTSSASEIQKHLKTVLPEYMVPGKIVTVERIPQTLNGKLDRKALINMLPASDLNHEDFVSPSTATERVVTQICSTLLGVSALGVTSGLFANGWHSILAAQAALQLEDIYQVNIPVQTTLVSENVADIIQFLVSHYGDQDIVEEISETYLLLASMSEEELKSLKNTELH
ncbi:amino acid adenylation domain-containing protein [Pseudoalteromonas sp. OOF1S-7]|uniref:non-ribosomal peptide synthetase n=1 Tax=Pseudoalteromonas sp. OOF1S-7 TaxID=2917757 RepID=UPI001EF589C1|nr:amino acid adenylation domain-containing protein [Pseudoalteromonas sp. OOF1S-7]MCG7534490.1 amino acid adenylation domain-containing protein [Pseudoalteromonas sp. OOF1S-7]